MNLFSAIAPHLPGWLVLVVLLALALLWTWVILPQPDSLSDYWAQEGEPVVLHVAPTDPYDWAVEGL